MATMADLYIIQMVRKRCITHALVRTKRYTTPQITESIHISGERHFVFLMSLLFFFFVTVFFINRYIESIFIRNRSLHVMALNNNLPDNFKNCVYRYYSETIKERNLKHSAMSLVYLKARSIYQCSFLSVIAPESILGLIEGFKLTFMIANSILCCDDFFEVELHVYRW